MPNLGKLLHLGSLVADLDDEREKGLEQKRFWYSQHLSIEIGIGLVGDRWAGAEFWQGAIDPTWRGCMRRRRSTRHMRMKRWLSWSHAWAHKGVLDQRKLIATKLTGLANRGELTIVGDDLIDVASLAAKGWEVG
jgi:phage terminase large subunit-like protein